MIFHHNEDNICFAAMLNVVKHLHVGREDY